MRTAVSLVLFLSSLSLPAMAQSSDVPNVSLELREGVFESGEKVDFAVVNRSGKSYYCRTDLWTVSRGDMELFKAWNGRLVSLASQGALALRWDQKDSDGRKVDPGRYTIRFQFWDNSKTYTLKADFDIRNPNSFKNVLVTTDKRSYVFGETVKIHLVNASTDAFTLLNSPQYLISRTNGKKTYVHNLPETTPALTLAAGMERVLSWDQKDGDGKQVDKGRYSAMVPLKSAFGDTHIRNSKTFSIKKKAVSGGSTSGGPRWGRGMGNNNRGMNGRKDDSKKDDTKKDTTKKDDTKKEETKKDDSRPLKHPPVKFPNRTVRMVAN